MKNEDVRSKTMVIVTVEKEWRVLSNPNRDIVKCNLREGHDIVPRTNFVLDRRVRVRFLSGAATVA